MSFKAYEKVLLCFSTYETIKHNKNAFVKNLAEALRYFALIIKALPQKDMKLLRSLERDFDIDKIINFSDAWNYWDDMYDILYKEKTPKSALDQRLFSGKYKNSEKYFKGIETLANKNVQKVAKIMSRMLPPNPNRKMIDLGAGPGVYSQVFIEKGIARKSICLDLPFVVEQYRKVNHNSLSWQASDLLKYNATSDEKYGLIFVANVLHHYDKNKIDKILTNISNIFEKEAFLVIQDYILWPKPALSPVYAAILGVHFALTTQGGRCYTSSEIVSFVEKRLDFLKFHALINAGQMDLLIFKKGDS